MKTVKILLSCPSCGETNWYPVKDGFECAACEEFAYTEDMCTCVATVDPITKKLITDKNEDTKIVKF